MFLHLHKGCSTGPEVAGPTTVSNVIVDFSFHLTDVRHLFPPAPDHAVCPILPLIQHRGQAL